MLNISYEQVLQIYNQASYEEPDEYDKLHHDLTSDARIAEGHFGSLHYLVIEDWANNLDPNGEPLERLVSITVINDQRESYEFILENGNILNFPR